MFPPIFYAAATSVGALSMRTHVRAVTNRAYQTDKIELLLSCL